METHPLRFLRNLRRTREIVAVLLRHGFGDLLERLHLGKYLRWGRKVLFRREEREVPLSRAVRIRRALEELGPTFIKFGQVLSTRPDLVPEDVVEELCRLQENVPPFSSEAAKAAVSRELEVPLEQVFAEFEEEPIAAASLAQVHRGRLRDGSDVAVKIRRPNVVHEVERDLALLQEFAVLLERRVPESQVFDPTGLVAHFARTIRREVNFRREGRTVDEFGKLFRKDASLFVPKVYWDCTTSSVLVLEFVDGLRPDDPEALRAAGIDPHAVAVNGARIYMKQAFELGVFHGDPHPGNVRVMEDGSLCLLDYGMIGMLDRELKEQLVDLFVALVHQRVDDAVAVALEITRWEGEIDKHLLRADVRDFVETYYGYSLERIEVGNLLTDFVSILSSHGLRCPPDLMLLIRALVTLEGVGRGLDPEFNLAEHLQPFVESLIRRRYHPREMAERVTREARRFGRVLYDIPLQVGTTLDKLSRDEFKVKMEHRDLDRFITELDRSGNRVVVGLVMSSLILASALLLRSGAGQYWITLPLFVLSSLLGMWLVYGIFRSGQL